MLILPDICKCQYEIRTNLHVFTIFYTIGGKKIEQLMLRIFFLILGSLGILLLSWDSLRKPNSHGFYRFFAFEAILILIVLNLEYWFQSPLSVQQIFSWILLTASLILAVHGFHLLRGLGKPEGGIEHTTQLVTSGAYKFIRHPLYSSLLLFSLGAFLKHPTLAGLALMIVIAGFMIATARVEENENLQHFGTEYATYIQNTKMFIPLIW